MDDVFFFWRGSKEDLELFVRHFNGIKYRVQFTLEVEKEGFISGCGDLRIAREVGHKNLQKSNSHSSVHKLELQPPKKYVIRGVEGSYTSGTHDV